MNKKNLPVKIILQRNGDLKRNKGGGSKKLFGEVNQQLQAEVIENLEKVKEYYDDIFAESGSIPAVAKMKVKKEAIA